MIRRRLVLYIAAGTIAMACRPRVVALVPVALVPAHPDSAVAWARGTAPLRSAAIRFRWRYEDRQVVWGGRGTARIAPPDSLRFDYAGPLGLGSGAGVVIGESILWAEPSGDFERLIPAVPMLWAALGTVRPPLPGATVFTTVRERDDARVRYWRFVQGTDTLDYALSMGPGRVLEAEWRRGARVVARSRTEYDGDQPAASRIDVPAGPGRIDFTVVGVDTAVVFPAALWHRRR